RLARAISICRRGCAKPRIWPGNSGATRTRVFRGTIRSRPIRGSIWACRRQSRGRHMNTAEISGALGALLAELVDGASKEGGYMLNPGDEGLLRSVGKVSGAGR